MALMKDDSPGRRMLSPPKSCFKQEDDVCSSPEVLKASKDSTRSANKPYNFISFLKKEDLSAPTSITSSILNSKAPSPSRMSKERDQYKVISQKSMFSPSESPVPLLDDHI